MVKTLLRSLPITRRKYAADERARKEAEIEKHNEADHAKMRAASAPSPMSKKVI